MTINIKAAAVAAGLLWGVLAMCATGVGNLLVVDTVRHSST